jgi:hypothetical protein
MKTLTRIRIKHKKKDDNNEDAESPDIKDQYEAHHLGPEVRYGSGES